MIYVMYKNISKGNVLKNETIILFIQKWEASKKR